MASDEIIRPFEPADADALAHLIHRAIHEGSAGAYDEAQRAAWSPHPRSSPDMIKRVEGQTVLLAEDAAGLTGVFTLTQDGLIDLAFVRPDRMGQGTAGRLYTAILEQARFAGHTELRVEASHLARRFFQKRGWALVATQTVQAGATRLENHRMVHRLG